MLNWNAGELPPSEAGRLRLLTIWSLRAARRRVVHELFHSPQGLLALGALIFGAISARSIVLQELPPLADARGHAVALLLANLVLQIGFLAGFIAILTRDQIVRQQPAPLRDFSFTHPAYLGYRVFIEAAVVVGAQQIGLFYLFHGKRMAAALGPGWLTIPVHLIATLATLLVLTKLGFSVFRAMLTRPGLFRHARAVYVGSGLGMVLAVGASPLLPHWIVYRRPDFLLDFPEQLLTAAQFLAPAHSAALSAHMGRWSAIVWLGAMLALASVAWRHALAEIHLEALTAADGAAPVAADQYRSLFSDLSASRRLRLFWRKDFTVRFLRRPLRLLMLHWLLVSGLVGAMLAIRFLSAQGTLPAWAHQPAASGLVIILAGCLAAIGGLASLGSEGRALSLLRPAVTPWELYWWKCTAAVAFTAPQSLIYGFVVGTSLAFLDPSRAVLGKILGLSVVVGVLFAITATSIGFLLPDLEQKSAFLRGSSLLGRMIFIAAVVQVALVVSTAEILLTSVGLVKVYWLILALIFVLGLGTSLIVASLAVHRLTRIEL